MNDSKASPQRIDPPPQEDPQKDPITDTATLNNTPIKGSSSDDNSHIRNDSSSSNTPPKDEILVMSDNTPIKDNASNNAHLGDSLKIQNYCA
jgi:hypothetical protein